MKIVSPAFLGAGQDTWGAENLTFGQLPAPLSGKEAKSLRPFDHGPTRPSGGDLLSQGPSEHKIAAWQLLRPMKRGAQKILLLYQEDALEAGQK